MKGQRSKPIIGGVGGGDWNCFSTKNIDVSPLFDAILYCTFSEHLLTNEIPRKIT